MNEPNAQQADELGAPTGPQAAAQEALRVEVAGHEQAPGASEPARPGPDGETWEELLRNAIGSLFAMAGSRWPKMAATEKEINVLAKGWAPVCEKHCGATIPVEYLAIGATVLIVGPKVVASIGDANKEKAAQRAEHQHRDATTTHV